MATPEDRHDQIVPLRRADDQVQVVGPAQGPEQGPMVFEAMRDFWWLILFVTLVGAGLGTAFGLLRQPTYTGEARLAVGRIDVGAQTISGFASAAASLADSYSRAIVAPEVVKGTAKKSGVPPADVLDRISASPIPQSPVMEISATGTSERQAKVTTNAAAAALTGYVRRLNRFNPDSRDLLRRFNRASERYSQAVAAQAAAPGDPAKEAAVSSARLQQQTASDLYRASQAGQSVPNTLQVLALAADASSDQGSTLQRAIFAGIVLGFLAGAALAQLAYRRY